ncbi:MAG: DNA topoisomerase IV subunit B, partial [Conchiformibius sp.]|nr:DNA topoisomerase IV subunit B [Conchiformibius sp.]
ELDGIIAKLHKENVRENAYSVSRFKGLGEMNPDQLKDTTMHPDTRRLLQVGVDDAEHTQAVFVRLMGKGEAAARRAWMEREGDRAEADI